MLIAMGNKYYDGVIFRIPLVCMEGSFMGELCTKNNTGISLDVYRDDFTQVIYDYYVTLDKKEFFENCDKETKRVMSEYDKGSEIVRNISI